MGTNRLKAAMKRFTPGFVVVLLVDLLLLFLCLIHLPSVAGRSRAPFEAGISGEQVHVVNILDQPAADRLRPGDRLLQWAEQPLAVPEAIEFLADMRSIGDRVALTIERGGSRDAVTVTLIPFYPSPRFLIITAIVGIVIWLIGLFVHWSGQPGLTTGVLHWAMMAFAVTILITPGGIVPDSLLSTIDRVLFFFSYMGVVALFFFFTLLYPSPKATSKFTAALLTFLPALTLAGGMSFLQVQDIRSGTLQHFAEFQSLFNLFQFSLFVYVGGAIVCIMMSFRNARTTEERKRMQWIVWGLCIGSAPFLFFHVLPQLLISRYLIPEEYATVFFLAIPFSFSISFLRYHFLDIEVLINRSLVYAILSLLGVVTFALAFLLVTSAFNTHAVFGEYLVIAGISLVMALLFAPARDRLQHVIDEALFAARANFRRALAKLSVQLHDSLTTDDLFRALAEGLSALIPVRSLGVYEKEGRGLQRRANKGDEAPAWMPIPVERLSSGESPLWTLPGSIASGIPADESKAQWLEEAGFATCLMMTDESAAITGAIGLSPRVRGDKFQQEEMDLLAAAASMVTEIRSKLKLRERMFLEAAEGARLRELNELKSYFVSSVSHELRMPLTSIRMFAETLRLGRVSTSRQRNEYLEIIEGESERLGRLIENVLNFARIEKGIKEYKFESTDITAIARKAVAILRYEFKSAGGTLKADIPHKLPHADVDGEALQQVILNLLSNALKYNTGRKKRARLDIRVRKGFLFIDVSDNGIGIPPEELPRIFEKFYRVRDSRSRQVGGTGLGLPLVRHVVETHGGAINMKSVVGKGTTVSIRIPLKSDQ